MTPAETVLGGFAVATLAGIFGIVIGRKGKLDEGLCDERRTACISKISSELEHIKKDQGKMDKKLDEVLKIVTNKFLSI